MIHPNEDEIFELAEKVSSGEKLSEKDILAIRHIKECRACYGSFCVAIAIFDATTNEAIQDVSEMRRAEYAASQAVRKHVSVVAVIRQKIDGVKSAILEQINGVESAFSFEPALAMATRGDDTNTPNNIIKLEELDDEKTFIVFDSDKNELYIQVNTRNIQNKSLQAYLMFSDQRIVALPLTQEGGFLKGRINNLPDVDFKIYFEEA